MQEAARKQVLEVLRNFVFTIGQNLRALEQYIENFPQPVYIAARTLLLQFQDAGITPEIFPEFHDKEYVQQVREKLHVIVQNSQSRLTSTQMQQSELCVKFLIEMPSLDQAIGAHIAQGQLQATESEWRQISTRRTLFILGGILGMLLACPVMILFASLDIAFLGYIALLLLLGGGFILVLIKPQNYQTLYQSRTQWQTQIPNQTGWQEFVRLFGEPSHRWQELRIVRQQTIHQVMGQIPGYSQLLAH